MLLQYGGYRRDVEWGYMEYIERCATLRTENHMEKNMENEVETGGL